MHNSEKTHCMRGHLLSGDNLRVDKNGYRACRICINASKRTRHKNGVRYNPWVNSWHHAKSRCENPANASYRRYGAKGILFRLTVDEIKSIWHRDGASELKRPSLDRIDSAGNYTYENCRFIELSENVRLANAANIHKRRKCATRHPGIDGQSVMNSNGRMHCKTCRSAYDASRRKERRP